jgi:hypothetical protein
MRASEFDRLDRTAQSILWTLGCAQTASRARAQGLFGPPDSAGRSGQCQRKDGRTLALFFDPDSAFTKAGNLHVLDIGTRLAYSGPIDTSAILAEARAENDAELRGLPSYQRERRAVAPLSMRSDGDSIEVWLVPFSVLVGRTSSTVGGERGFIYSPDGRTLAREVDAFDRFRSISIPDTGAVAIMSQEEDLPLVSELIVTNDLFNRGRDVQLVTKSYASHLVGHGSNAVWMQFPRRR